MVKRDEARCVLLPVPVVGEAANRASDRPAGLLSGGREMSGSSEALKLVKEADDATD